MGQIDVAYDLIKLAKESGADFAKFQKKETIKNYYHKLNITRASSKSN